MTYFCFIESATSSLPHMEPLDAECPTTATAQARRLLYEHASGVAAHVYNGETMVASISRAALVNDLGRLQGAGVSEAGA